MSRALRINLIIVMCVLAGLTLIEFLIRTYYPQATYAIRTAPWGWRHIPTISFLHASEGGGDVALARVQYNVHGHRDIERSITRPANTKRILVLGDSFAEAMVSPVEEVHASVLERRLNQFYPKTSFEVINMGVYAYNTCQELMQLEAEGLQYDPDAVIVIYTMDDLENLHSDLCRLSAGRLVLEPIKFSWMERTRTYVKGWIKSQIHFATFLQSQAGVQRNTARNWAPAEDRLPKWAPIARDRPDLWPMIGERGGSDSREEQRGWELTKRIFLRMRDVLAARGVKLLVIATRFDPESSNEVIRRPSLLRKAFFDRAGIIVRFTASIRGLGIYGIPGDGHWNAKGHAYIARKMLGMLRQARVIKPLSQN